jgi:hypothetical protein
MAHYTKNIPRPDFKGETNTSFKLDPKVLCVHAETCDIKDCSHARPHAVEENCSELCGKKLTEKCKVVV